MTTWPGDKRSGNVSARLSCAVSPSADQMATPSLPFPSGIASEDSRLGLPRTMSDRPMTPATSTWNLPSCQAAVTSGTADWARANPANAWQNRARQRMLIDRFFNGNLLLRLGFARIVALSNGTERRLALLMLRSLRNLEVHHRRFRSRLWDDTAENLTSSPSVPTASERSTSFTDEHI